MISFIKNLYAKYKMKYVKTNEIKYEIYYNRVFDRYMYYQQCPICKYNIYMYFN